MIYINKKIINFSIANENDRNGIYKIRHDIYAKELGQHNENAEKKLYDKLDEFNIYIVAKKDNKIVGFISLTPPNKPSYSIDKYFKREELGFTIDSGFYEFRILTVIKSYRNTFIGYFLMYAAFRYAQENNASKIVAIGRKDIIDMYIKNGLIPHNLEVKSGKVTYKLMSANIDRIHTYSKKFMNLKLKALKNINWNFDFPLIRNDHCYHGGDFFESIGAKFENLAKSNIVINADVLDAWFDPSPKVLNALNEYMPWIIKTSPPTLIEGLIEKIAQKRMVKTHNIMPGAGSSELIYRIIPKLINKTSKVLLLNPTYGEYTHILNHVVKCKVEKFILEDMNNFEINLHKLENEIKKEYNLIILVNPNSPTGNFINKDDFIKVLNKVSSNTIVWIDETYIDYVGSKHSLESYAAEKNNIIICKSMSKVYALSGARVAYICANIILINKLMINMPPWIVSLPAQVAAIKALEDEDYYNNMYDLTCEYREYFVKKIKNLKIGKIHQGHINCFILFLDEQYKSKNLVNYLRSKNIFIRDLKNLESDYLQNAVRISVKSKNSNIEILKNIERFIQKSG